MDDLLKLVGTIGFPAAVAGFVLVRLEPVLRDIRDALVKLTTIMEEQRR